MRSTRRLADYARRINRELLRLEAVALDQLIYAGERQSDGLMKADVTVQTCWDADRLAFVNSSGMHRIKVLVQ